MGQAKHGERGVSFPWKTTLRKKDLNASERAKMVRKP